MPIHCCSRCFSNGSLRKIVSALEVQDTGTCDYCGASGIELIRPKDVEELLQPLFELFVTVDKLDQTHLVHQPKTIIEHLQQRWNIFSEDVIEPIRLLSAIFDGLNDEDQRLLKEPVYIACLNSGAYTDYERAWNEYVKEVKENNRYFPSVELGSLLKIDVLKRYVKTLPVGTKLFRARVSSSPNGHEENEMGKPPKSKATSGRVNPNGIPYLYVSYDYETPIYEARAGMIDYVTVATFETTAPIEVVPLKDYQVINPFDLEDMSDIPQTLLHEVYLEYLERELSRPIRKQDQELDYIPTQQMCEYIKLNVGAHGVEYGSSMKRNGINLVLFNDADVRLVDRQVYTVNRINLDISRIAIGE